MFARGLEEADRLPSDRRLAAIAGRYAEIGNRWSALAAAALPTDVELLDATRRELDDRARRLAEGAGEVELGDGWARLDAIGSAVDADFPLSEAAARALLAGLTERLREIVALEQVALDELEAAISR
jgi:hypothetical protein